GIIVVNKPQGWTSFDVIAKLRGVFATKKIGHSGTLDPMATGVLPLFVGRAVKAVDMQQESGKRYTATVLFGQKTDTGDITGEVLQTASCRITCAELQAVLPQFVGEIEQIPPMYSAIKIDGQPLYKLARKGQTVKREPRKITIQAINYIEEKTENTFVLDVVCSKGTYIRTLLEDIGMALGVPATMAGLVRTQSGPYTLAQSYTLQQLQSAKEDGSLESLLAPVESIFTLFERVDCDAETYKRMQNGAPTKVPHKDQQYKLYYENNFIGIVEVKEGKMQPVKLFIERN
ncbi:MAG: tRNA pseudouridine(55) synthase TruB, partial [Oscillospiraceae bacterium]|nr:tRNA pseudouridine(55) synthase TruB [Oscillospiraceae bacterium]